MAEPDQIGVEIDGGAALNVVGTKDGAGDDTAEGNVLSANSVAGVWISGSGTDGNAVAGNLIGTDISGSVALENGAHPQTDSFNDYIGGGVVIAAGASDNRIGTDGSVTDDPAPGNVIGASGNDGIDICGLGTDGNVVAGNFIGTNSTGTIALGIAGDGIFIAEGASANWIGVNPYGGEEVGDEGNVISGNGDYGVQIYGAGSDSNVVAGNKIGTDVTGKIGLANTSAGVMIEGAGGNVVGGLAAGAGNVISANGYDGVEINGSDGNVVAGNMIGTDATGQSALGNGHEGVEIDAATYSTSTGETIVPSTGNTIGGTSAAAGNLIRFNLGPGVLVTEFSSAAEYSEATQTFSTGNQITANRIFGNTGQAIDLGDNEVTDNASGPYQGPNNLQNFPIIVMTASGQMKGWLGGSEPDSPYRIDIFASAGYGPGGAGEAQDYLGSIEVTTDATGRAMFHGALFRRPRCTRTSRPRRPIRRETPPKSCPCTRAILMFPTRRSA